MPCTAYNVHVRIELSPSLSVGLSVGLFLYPEGVLWQNG